MKNLTKIMMIAALFILPACSDDDDSKNEQVTEESPAEQQTETQDSAETNDEGNSSEEEKDGSHEEAQADEGLLIYRPEVGGTRVFEENGQQLFTEEIIAANDEYLQLLVTLGGAQTTEIYKWTADELTLVYQEYADSNSPKESILEDFEISNETEIIIGADADWELLSENETVEINGQTYENVKKVKRITNEIVGSETIAVRYYAPGDGLVKEEVEVTGDNGYKSTVLLNKK